MTTVLFVTVGGSSQPIVTAIQSLNPDRVVFICSAGPRGSISQVAGQGTPCEIRRGAEVVAQLPNIPTQVNLGDRFNSDTDLVLLENPDDLAECYGLISDKCKAVRQANMGQTLYADYTGGTKTMSLALGMAALDYGISLYLTTSATRENLVKVERGESTERAPITLVMVERTLNQALPKLLEQFNYVGAIASLQTLLQSLELPADQKRKIRSLMDTCAGFDAWDRFDHAQAWLMLEPQMKQVQQHGLFLKRVLHSRSQIDTHFVAQGGIAGQGYEVIEDLLLNAARRAQQQRFDDAVGRVYRALELLAQMRLQQEYDIQTGDVALEKLPESLREAYAAERNPRNGKIQLALTKSYVLLSQFPNDPLGALYQEQSERLVHALNVRNHSLFAHGFQPITGAAYQDSGQVLLSFIEAGLDRLTQGKKRQAAPQFPTIL